MYALLTYQSLDLLLLPGATRLPTLHHGVCFNDQVVDSKKILDLSHHPGKCNIGKHIIRIIATSDMCMVPNEPTLLQGPWPLVEVRLLPDRWLEMYSVLVKGDSMK